MDLSNDNLVKEDDQQVLDTVIETQRGPILSNREKNEVLIPNDYTNQNFSNSFNLKSSPRQRKINAKK